MQSVGLVVNYDLPQTAAVYLHRIGRSGRFGRRGLAISFVADSEDANHLSGIAKTYSIAIGPVPAKLSDLTRLPKEELTIEKQPQKASVIGTKRPAEIHAIPLASTAKKTRKQKQRKKRKKRKKRALAKPSNHPDL